MIASVNAALLDRINALRRGIRALAAEWELSEIGQVDGRLIEDLVRSAQMPGEIGADLTPEGLSVALAAVDPELDEWASALGAQGDVSEGAMGLGGAQPRADDARAAVRPVGGIAVYVRRLQTFSRRAFGPGKRVRSLLDHLRKELTEIEADPSSVEEWVDVAMSALDGAVRCGATAEEVEAQLHGKLAVCEQRTWPDWRTASPDHAIEHVPEEDLGEFRVFNLRWFDCVEWGDQDFRLVARSEAEARAWADSQRSPEHRARPAYGLQRTDEDSLVIVDEGPIGFPWVIR